MKRISRRVREQAALICAVAASSRDLLWGTSSVAYHLGIVDEDEPYQLQSPACVLVAKAFERANDLQFRRHKPQDWFAVCAEAEAMLRTGWEP